MVGEGRRSEPEHGAEQTADVARIDAELALVVGAGAVVHQRQRELLARRAVAAGGAVERHERDVLQRAVDAAGVRQRPLHARVGDPHGVGCEPGLHEPRAGGHRQHRGAGGRNDRQPAPVTRKHGQRCQQGERTADHERGRERLLHAGHERVVGATGERRVGGAVVLIDPAARPVERRLQLATRVDGIEVADQRARQ
jgi:hypothetical protein